MPVEPAMPFDIETELRTFLREQREADTAGLLRRIWDQLNQHEKDDERRHAELHGDLRGLSLRVGALEKDNAKFEDKLEDTGKIQIDKLQKEIEKRDKELEKRDKEKTDKTTWWSQQKTLFVIALVLLSLQTWAAHVFVK